MKRVMRSEQGVVAPMVSVMLIGLIAIAALVVDGGVAVSARRDLQMLADGASRAGAMALDIPELRATGRARLDPTLAARAARAYLRAAGFNGTVRVRATIGSTTVDLSQNRPTVLIGFLGIGHILVRAHAIARPRTGIERPGG